MVKKTYNMGSGAAFLVALFFMFILLGAYALAILCLVVLFKASVWYGLAGLVAYICKPKFTIKK